MVKIIIISFNTDHFWWSSMIFLFLASFSDPSLRNGWQARIWKITMTVGLSTCKRRCWLCRYVACEDDAAAVTIGITFYRHVRDFNESDSWPVWGHKDTWSANKLRTRYKPRAAKTSLELLVTAYVTNLMSFCVSAYNVLGVCSEGGWRRWDPVTRGTFCGNKGREGG